MYLIGTNSIFDRVGRLGTDDYAKDGRPEEVSLLCIFTMMLCGLNFCVW